MGWNRRVSKGGYIEWVLVLLLDLVYIESTSRWCVDGCVVSGLGGIDKVDSCMG